MSDRSPTGTLPGGEIGPPAPSYAADTRRDAPPAEDYARFVAVMTEAFDRLKAGERRYGPFSASWDGRDLLQEAEEELLDAIIYCYFAVLKLRAAERRKEEIR